MSQQQPAGVIHDIGYRHYEGPRLGRGAILRGLIWQGVRSTYGLGRTAKSKIFPFILLGCMLLPALILEAVLIFARNLAEQSNTPLPFTEQPLAYTSYVLVTSGAIALFLAAQAPQLFSRDLRFGVLPLYFSRPITRADYVLAKYLSLMGGLIFLMLVPLLVMYAGGLLAKLPAGEQTAQFLSALLGMVVFAAVLAGVGGLIASVTVRRGWAVAAIITVGTVSLALAGMLLGIGQSTGNDALSGAAGLFSPPTLIDGLQSVLFDRSSGLTSVPHGGGWVAVYLLGTIAYLAVPVALLVWRYRRVSGV